MRRGCRAFVPTVLVGAERGRVGRPATLVADAAGWVRGWLPGMADARGCRAGCRDDRAGRAPADRPKALALRGICSALHLARFGTPDVRDMRQRLRLARAGLRAFRGSRGFIVAGLRPSRRARWRRLRLHLALNSGGGCRWLRSPPVGCTGWRPGMAGHGRQAWSLGDDRAGRAPADRRKALAFRDICTVLDLACCGTPDGRDIPRELRLARAELPVLRDSRYTVNVDLHRGRRTRLRPATKARRARGVTRGRYGLIASERTFTPTPLPMRCRRQCRHPRCRHPHRGLASVARRAAGRIAFSVTFRARLRIAIAPPRVAIAPSRSEPFSPRHRRHRTSRSSPALPATIGR